LINMGRGFGKGILHGTHSRFTGQSSFLLTVYAEKEERRVKEGKKKR
jgi:hypothetical protein